MMVSSACLPHLTVSDGISRAVSVHFDKLNTLSKYIEVKGCSISIYTSRVILLDLAFCPERRGLYAKILSVSSPIGSVRCSPLKLDLS
jgi:hypothetical protein